MAAYLGTLQELQFVERVVPVTETQPHKSRRGQFRLSDPFLRFWFRFAQPNRTTLERGGSAAVLRTNVLPQLDTFTGPVFERVCEQHLWHAGLTGALPFTPARIGGWWRASEEVALVALGDGEGLVVECKWSRKPIGTNVLCDLERKATRITSIGDRRVHFGLCSRSGFTDAVLRSAAERGDAQLFDLDQIVSGT